MAVWAFNRMLVHDNNIKKTVFIFIIAYICIITKVNGHCARTAWFLMCVVLGQTVLVGACVGCKDIIVNYVNNTNMDSNIKKENNKNSTKKKNCRNC